MDNLNHLSHPNHPDHPDLDLNDQPNQVSYNPDHQKIYQKDNYRICIIFVLLTLSCFKSFLFMSRYYCQSHCWNNAQTPSMLFFWAGCANFLPENAKTLLVCILL